MDRNKRLRVSLTIYRKLSLVLDKVFELSSNIRLDDMEARVELVYNIVKELYEKVDARSFLLIDLPAMERSPIGKLVTAGAVVSTRVLMVILARRILGSDGFYQVLRLLKRAQTAICLGPIQPGTSIFSLELRLFSRRRNSLRSQRLTFSPPAT